MVFVALLIIAAALTLSLILKSFFERRGSVSNETSIIYQKGILNQTTTMLSISCSKPRKFQAIWMDEYDWQVFSAVKKGGFLDILLCLFVIKLGGGLTKK